MCAGLYVRHDPARYPAPTWGELSEPKTQIASLDHAMWFTARSAPMTGCSTPSSPASSGGRGRFRPCVHPRWHIGLFNVAGRLNRLHVDLSGLIMAEMCGQRRDKLDCGFWNNRARREKVPWLRHRAGRQILRWDYAANNHHHIFAFLRAECRAIREDKLDVRRPAN